MNRLQYLASNCYMINMYGTTETQRAVSFLKIPPSNIHPGFLTEQKDVCFFIFIFIYFLLIDNASRKRDERCSTPSCKQKRSAMRGR